MLTKFLTSYDLKTAFKFLLIGTILNAVLVTAFSPENFGSQYNMFYNMYSLGISVCITHTVLMPLYLVDQKGAAFMVLPVGIPLIFAYVLIFEVIAVLLGIALSFLIPTITTLLYILGVPSNIWAMLPSNIILFGVMLICASVAASLSILTAEGVRTGLGGNHPLRTKPLLILSSLSGAIGFIFQGQEFFLSKQHNLILATCLAGVPLMYLYASKIFIKKVEIRLSPQEI